MQSFLLFDMICMVVATAEAAHAQQANASPVQTSADRGGNMLAVGCSLRSPMNSPEDSAANDPAFQDSISLDLGLTSSSFIDKSSFLFCTHLASSMPESGGMRRLCLTESGDSNVGETGSPLVAIDSKSPIILSMDKRTAPPTKNLDRACIQGGASRVSIGTESDKESENMRAVDQYRCVEVWVDVDAVATEQGAASASALEPGNEAANKFNKFTSDSKNSHNNSAAFASNDTTAKEKSGTASAGTGVNIDSAFSTAKANSAFVAVIVETELEETGSRELRRLAMASEHDTDGQEETTIAAVADVSKMNEVRALYLHPRFIPFESSSVGIEYEESAAHLKYDGCSSTGAHAFTSNSNCADGRRGCKEGGGTTCTGCPFNDFNNANVDPLGNNGNGATGVNQVIDPRYTIERTISGDKTTVSTKHDAHSFFATRTQLLQTQTSAEQKGRDSIDGAAFSVNSFLAWQLCALLIPFDVSQVTMSSSGSWAVWSFVGALLMSVPGAGAAHIFLPMPKLSGINPSTTDKGGMNLQACVDDCDFKENCATGLSCSEGENGEPVPGCSGIRGGETFEYDYCYDPNCGTGCGLNYAVQEWTENKTIAQAKYNSAIEDWDISRVRNLDFTFRKYANFNADISKWNTLSVTSMRAAFSGATNFNADISNWNTASVTDMRCVFSGATNFNVDISNWNMESVTHMQCMFECTSSEDCVSVSTSSSTTWFLIAMAGLLVILISVNIAKKRKERRQREQTPSTQLSASVELGTYVTASPMNAKKTSVPAYPGMNVTNSPLSCSEDDRFKNKNAVFGALADRDVVLLSAMWIIRVALGMELKELGKNRRGDPIYEFGPVKEARGEVFVLPRRQDLPVDAVLTAEQVRLIHDNGLNARIKEKCLPIVSLSYAWLAREHPDPEGKQLKFVAKALMEGFLAEADGDPAGYINLAGFSDIGVFWDYGSIYQEHGGKKGRTPEQKASFKRALKDTMDLWYAHPMITKYFLTSLPDGTLPSNKITYGKRGWPFFERTSAQLSTPTKACGWAWAMTADLGAGGGISTRTLPLLSTDFNQEVADRSFTNGADEKMVRNLYKKTVDHVLGNREVLEFEDMDLSEPSHVGRLCKVLNAYPIKEVKLGNCQITCYGANVFGIAMMANNALEMLDLKENCIGDKGAKAIGEALKTAMRSTLKVLNLRKNNIGDEGAKAIGLMLATNTNLRKLWLSNNKIGEEGAKALGGALESNSRLESLDLRDNIIRGKMKSELVIKWGDRRGDIFV